MSLGATPAERFDCSRRIVALEAAGLPIPLDLAQWRAGRDAAILAGEDPREMFGLRAEPGERSPVRRAVMNERNLWIRDLVNTVQGDTPTEQFAEVVYWLAKPEAAPPAVQSLVHRLRRLGVPLPKSVRGIEHAVARAQELAPCVSSAKCEISK